MNYPAIIELGVAPNLCVFIIMRLLWFLLFDAEVVDWGPILNYADP